MSPRSGALSEGQEARTGRETKTPMPELPEVETVRAGLAQHIKGRSISLVAVHRRDLRVPVPAGLENHVKGRKITNVQRRAKYLLLSLEGGLVLVIHLGMSGRLIVRKAGHYEPQKHDHVLFSLEGGQEMVFNDARRFGLVTVVPESELLTHALFRSLGPEPFSDAFSTGYLAQKLAQRHGPLKPALMDQSLVVGVGNIYASEALYRARLHPALPAHKGVSRADALITEIRAVLQEAIDAGGSTLRNYAKASGESGYFQHKFSVYGREGTPCQRCNTLVTRITQAGRSTFFCASCQPPVCTPRRRG